MRNIMQTIDFYIYSRIYFEILFAGNLSMARAVRSPKNVINRLIHRQARSGVDKSAPAFSALVQRVTIVRFRVVLTRAVTGYFS